MIPGAVYYVTWIEQGLTLQVRKERLRFESEHPSGMLVFAFEDGFGSVAVIPSRVMGYQLAEANR